MKNILIFGATGFIGEGVAQYLTGRDDLTVVKHSRQDKKGYLCCPLDSPLLHQAVANSDYIINCAGVGLSKMVVNPDINNSVITASLINAIKNSGKPQMQLLHLSTIKAFNPQGYDDRYASDKYRCEQMLLQHSSMIKGELLRIPAVFGKGDLNLAPVFGMAARRILPIVNGANLPSSYFLGVMDIAQYIKSWIDDMPNVTLTVSYLLSKNQFNYNDLTTLVYQVMQNRISTEHRAPQRLPQIQLWQLRLLYATLGLLGRLSLGQKRDKYPKERFGDLFERSWTKQPGSIKTTHCDVELSTLIRSYSEKI